MAEAANRNFIINFGPQHPVAHGVLSLVLELDGEASAFTGRQPPHGPFGFCGASTSRSIKVQSDGAQLVVTAER
jgi:hypothetical protein